ncbi:hypothetical protein [Micromonospora sp. NPDC005367]|uniref:hypothetical protein n=1 Tax=Micromonospora sp. NPDC005367 TaxID=3155590 RepID=UPI0033B4A021
MTLSAGSNPIPDNYHRATPCLVVCGATVQRASENQFYGERNAELTRRMATLSASDRPEER